LGILGLNWINDTFAYLTGSLIGKTPFFPRISPKKTWEGTLGGIFFTVIIAWGISYYLNVYTPNQWVAIAASVAIFGTLGDLIESMLKRSVGVKDSGNIMPGHGGFLDRFDSFVFLLPFVWIVLRLF
jgi:phosphatidate cytidylyltransferase